MAEEKKDWIAPVAIVAGLAAVGGGLLLYKSYSQKKNVPYDLKITGYKNTRSGETKTAGETLSVLSGEVVEVYVEFSYKGVSFTPEFQVQTYVKGPLLETAVTTVTVSGPAVEETSKVVTVKKTVSMTLNKPLLSSEDDLYGLKATIKNVEDFSEVAVVASAIHLTSTTYEGEIQTPVITGWPTAAIKQGETCNITVQFYYKGPARTLEVEAALGSAIGILWNTCGNSINTVEKDVQASTAWVNYTVEVPIVADTGSGSGKWDIEAQVEGVNAEKQLNKVEVDAPAAVSLTDFIYINNTPRSDQSDDPVGVFNIGATVTIKIPLESTFEVNKTVIVSGAVYAAAPATTRIKIADLASTAFTVPPGSSYVEYNYVVTSHTLTSRDIGVVLRMDDEEVDDSMWQDIFTVSNVVSPGTLVLSLSPSNAYFLLEGEELTPGSYSLEAGSYGWTCTKAGYQSKSGTVSITSGQTKNLSVTLTKIPTGIEILTDPVVKDAQLEFRLTGFNPYSVVTVEVEGYYSQTASTWETNSQGATQGYFVISIPTGTHTLKAYDAYGNVATEDFYLQYGEVILDYVWIYPASYSGYTYFDCRYLDPVTGNWYDAGVNSVYSFATLINIHSGGTLAIAGYYNGEWGSWRYLYNVELEASTGYYYDMLYNVLY